MIGLRHIEVFHAVYVAGSVSGAARMLHVSQPSVTKVLRHAESVLGFALFERRNGRLIATEDAHDLFGEAEAINARVQSLRHTAANMRFGRTGLLRIAAPPSLSLGVLPLAVADYLGRHPNVRFDLQTVQHDDMARKLQEREVDFVLSHGVPSGQPLASRLVGRGELVVLFNRGDLPGVADSVTLAELAGKPFINLKRSGPVGHQLAAGLERDGVVVSEVACASTIYIAAALVRQRVGVTVVDNFTAAAMAVEGMASRPLSPALGFQIHAVHLETRPLSRTALAFLKAVSTQIGRLRHAHQQPTPKEPRS
jgi:DNA-binding transcriptional LysR family regulator